MLRLRRKEKSAQECKEWINQTPRNWLIQLKCKHLIGRKLFIFVFSTKFTDCSYETYIYGKVWSRTIVSLIIGTFVCERKKLRRFESRVSYFMSRSCMVAIFHARGLLKFTFLYRCRFWKLYIFFKKVCI